VVCAYCVLRLPQASTFTGWYGFSTSGVANSPDVVVTSGSFAFVTPSLQSSLYLGSLVHTSTLPGASFGLPSSVSFYATDGLRVNLTQGVITVGGLTSLFCDVALAAQTATFGSGAAIYGNVELAPPLSGGAFNVFTGPMVYDPSQSTITNAFTSSSTGFVSTATLRF
jgi:hypothetical protein